MTATHSDMIWTLDGDPACVTLYQQLLGLHYKVRAFGNVNEFLEALVLGEGPRLLITDPGNTSGSLIESFKRIREVSTNSTHNSSLRLPDFMVVSAIDDLDLLRFYLKAGARDYVFKPIRPPEIVAKVEWVLQQLSNREVLILRNDLDGVQISDLTFREHQILTIFISRNSRCVSRDELYEAIWAKVAVNKKTLDVHLFNLRRKLRPYGYDIVCRDQVFTLGKQACASPE